MNTQTHSRKWRLAVDVGGTFIDFTLLNTHTGEVIVDKQPSKPGALVEAFMTGFERLPVAVHEIELLVHGTTQGLNALVQEKGVPTGLITTRGTRDVLLIGRAARVNMYDPHYSPQTSLIPRANIQEVEERIDAQGNVLQHLQVEDLDHALSKLLRQGVEAVAIMFLHSYRFPQHEQEAAKYIKSHYPSIAVTCSSDLSREWREYERSSTAVSNAFIQPGFEAYVHTLLTKLRDAGYTQDVVFVQSNGGSMPATVAADKPVRTLNSGPAGGIIGAQRVALAHGFKNVITTDVGGTTYDVGLIVDGITQERSVTSIHDRPILAPTSDIASIGAGGGSIAQLDPLTGGLRVGPESAGAQPGPACFGNGGKLPTVTDCQLVLGWLDSTEYLGSRLVLDVNAAEQVIREKIADPAHMTLEQTADGVLEVAEANMANAIRQITTQRGLDPTEFTIVAYGGGGGLFAANVADNLGVSQVLIPPHAATFSAWGMLSSGFREDKVLTKLRPFTLETAPSIIEDLLTLEKAATQQIHNYGLTDETPEVQFELGMRYRGQSHSLNIQINRDWVASPDSFMSKVSERFTHQHFQRYGHGSNDAATEIMMTRVRSEVKNDVPTPPALTADTRHQAPIRPVYFRETGWRLTPSLERNQLVVGSPVEGPSIINDTSSTILVPPGWTISRNIHNALLLTRETS